MQQVAGSAYQPVVVRGVLSYVKPLKYWLVCIRHTPKAIQFIIPPLIAFQNNQKKKKLLPGSNCVHLVVVVCFLPYPIIKFEFLGRKSGLGSTQVQQIFKCQNHIGYQVKMYSSINSKRCKNTELQKSARMV